MTLAFVIALKLYGHWATSHGGGHPIVYLLLTLGLLASVFLRPGFDQWLARRKARKALRAMGAEF